MGGGTPEKVVALCDEKFKVPLNRASCSHFVIAVALDLGYPLAGNADAIVKHINKYFYKVDSGAEAARWATQGFLVIAGLQSSECADKKTTNGHLAIIVPGELYRGKYPLVWCGSTGEAQSKGTKSVGEVWPKLDRDKVHYYRAPAAS